MTIELRSLCDHGLQESVDLIKLGFSDYFVHIELTLPMFLNIARRGWTSRLAAMCIAPGARGGWAVQRWRCSWERRPRVGIAAWFWK